MGIDESLPGTDLRGIAAGDHFDDRCAQSRSAALQVAKKPNPDGLYLQMLPAGPRKDVPAWRSI